MNHRLIASAVKTDAQDPTRDVGPACSVCSETAHQTDLVVRSSVPAATWLPLRVSPRYSVTTTISRRNVLRVAQVSIWRPASRVRRSQEPLTIGDWPQCRI